MPAISSTKKIKKLKASSAIDIQVYLSATNICIMDFDYGNTFIGVIG